MGFRDLQPGRQRDKHYHDDPVVNAIVGLPSQEEAEQYSGRSPSFYGVQRPGDWQRKVQGEMAAEALPGGREQLMKLQESERERARRRNLGPRQV